MSIISIIKCKIKFKDKSNLIFEICDESKLPMDIVMKKVEYAEELGIPIEVYYDLGYWNIPDGKLKDAHFNGSRRKKLAKNIAKKHGKSPIDIEKQIIHAKYALGLRIGYFKKYDWDELTDEEKDTIFLRPHSRQMSLKYRKKDSNSNVFNNKSLFNETFSKYIGREWFYYDEAMSYDDFCSNLEKFNTEHIIYKPRDLSGGVGIKKYSRKDYTRNIFDSIKKDGAGMIEEFVVQHVKMSAICNDCVNTIRVVTLCIDDDEPKLLYAVCRMGSGNGKPADNSHQGGMYAGIDMNTGCIDTIAVDSKAKPYSHHPATGIKLVGYEIPHWDSIVALCKTASKHAMEIAGLGYAGWDIAVTERGPILIEGNNWPSPGLIQVPHFVQSRRGMKYLIEDYL